MNDTILAIIGGLFGLLGSIIAGYLAIRQAKMKREIALTKIGTAKDIDLVKIKTDRDVKFQEQLYKGQSDYIHQLEKRHDSTEERLNKVEIKLSECLDEKNKVQVAFRELQLDHEYTKAVLRGIKGYEASKLAVDDDKLGFKVG